MSFLSAEIAGRLILDIWSLYLNEYLSFNRATIEDRTLLSTFTANLSQNQQEWEGRALVAKEELQAAEDSYRWGLLLFYDDVIVVWVRP
jgi:hypothetical protein